MSGKRLLRKNKYLKTHGSICPYCDSENIEAEAPADFDGPDGTQFITCLDCKRRWKDFLKMEVVDVEAAP